LGRVALDLPLFLLFAVPITLFDLRQFRIPDVLSIGGLLAFAALRVLSGSLPGSLWEPVAGCALGFGSFYLIRMATHGKLGLGDAKFSAMIAVATGMRGWFVAVFVAAAAGLVCAALLMGGLKAGSKTRIAFAPFLALGGALAVALEGPIASGGWETM
jgi:prepilin signal peptidase PulO-like enzyme (type II secretory pathway)